jgi:hypothetical protein
VPGRRRVRVLLLDSRLPPYLVLLRVGFTLPPPLLPERCALTAPFHPYRWSLAAPAAVCFLWHWPSTGLEARVPDVIRHTALRSSDFPPPATRFPESPAATARSSCQHPVYRESRIACGTYAPAHPSLQLLTDPECDVSSPHQALGANGQSGGLHPYRKSFPHPATTSCFLRDSKPLT